MQILTLRTAALLLLTPAFVGCAALQQDSPGSEPVEGQSTPFDYIDDRTTDDVPTEELRYDDVQDTSVEVNDTEYRDLDSQDVRIEDQDIDDDRPPEEHFHQLSLLAGVRDFSDDGIFGRVDTEFALGIEYAQEIGNGFGFELGAAGSLSTDNGIASNPDVTGASAELYTGARYWLKNDSLWTPYVGAGLSLIFAGVDDDQGGQVADDQDTSLGVYVHGGVQYQVNDLIYIGGDVRALLATDLDLDTISGDADYLQLMLVFGFSL